MIQCPYAFEEYAEVFGREAAVPDDARISGLRFQVPPNTTRTPNVVLDVRIVRFVSKRDAFDAVNDDAVPAFPRPINRIVGVATRLEHEVAQGIPTLRANRSRLYFR